MSQQAPKKYNSSPSDRDPASSDQPQPNSRTSAEHQNTSPQTYTTIPQTWPSHHTITTTTRTRTTQGTSTSTETSAAEPTSMQRWINESPQESPWNGIAEVEVGRERYGEGADGGMGDKGSAAGTWGSRSE